MLSQNQGRKISTTALSKTQGMPTKDMFSRLLMAGYIVRQGDSWSLTESGKQHGGVLQSSKHGQYIIWPENMAVPAPLNDASDAVNHAVTEKLITATAIGKQFGLSATRVNFILSEIGWVSKHMKGWVLTAQGKRQGGKQVEDHRSGVPYVRWPASIAESTILRETIGHGNGAAESGNLTPHTSPEELSFRDRFKATHRSTDGHMVRSKAEMLIDNWLYMAEIVHAYERKLPIEEEVYSDFYIPTGKVYIEYWGLEDDPKYLARKEAKQALYGKYGFSLIELHDKEVQNLDDILPKLLLRHGVQAY